MTFQRPNAADRASENRFRDLQACAPNRILEQRICDVGRCSGCIRICNGLSGRRYFKLCLIRKDSPALDCCVCFECCIAVFGHLPDMTDSRIQRIKAFRNHGLVLLDSAHAVDQELLQLLEDFRRLKILLKFLTCRLKVSLTGSKSLSISIGFCVFCSSLQ